MRLESLSVLVGRASPQAAGTLIALTALLCFVGAGCLNLEPAADPTRHFLLSSMPADAESSGPAESGLSLGIAPVSVPAYLGRPWVVVRTSDTEIRYSDYFKWGEHLDKGIQQTLAAWGAMNLQGTGVDLHFPGKGGLLGMKAPRFLEVERTLLQAYFPVRQAALHHCLERKALDRAVLPSCRGCEIRWTGPAFVIQNLKEGRIYTERPWSDYGGGGGYVVFEHPLMSEGEMLDANSEVMRRGYSVGRIVKRTLHAVTHGCSMDVAKTAFFMQLGLRKAYRQLYDEVQARPRFFWKCLIPNGSSLL